MQAKFTQINEFLKLLSHTGGELDRLAARAAAAAPAATATAAGSTAATSSGTAVAPAAVRILDAGCGSSHLTFGTYHYLHSVRGVPVQLMGVDTNKALMQRSNKAVADLGIDQAHFVTAGEEQYSKCTVV